MKKDKRAAELQRMLDHAGAMGWKNIPVEMNPFLHDEDFPELVERVQATREENRRQKEAQKLAKAEEKAARKSAKEDK